MAVLKALSSSGMTSSITASAFVSSSYANLTAICESPSVPRKPSWLRKHSWIPGGDGIVLGASEGTIEGKGDTIGTPEWTEVGSPAGSLEGGIEGDGREEGEPAEETVGMYDGTEEGVDEAEIDGDDDGIVEA